MRADQLLLGRVCILLVIHISAGYERFYGNYGSIGNVYGYGNVAFAPIQNFPQPQRVATFPLLPNISSNMKPQLENSLSLQTASASEQFSSEMVYVSQYFHIH